MNTNDESRPRSLTITLVDEGESYLVTAERNRVEPGDEDVCDMLAHIAAILDELHTQAHFARDLAGRSN